MLRFPVPMLRDICLFIPPSLQKDGPAPRARNAKARAGLTARGAAAVQHHGQSPARLG